MGALDVEDVSGPTTQDCSVSVAKLSELTGFPVDYITRELSLESDNSLVMTMEELRKKVLVYLDSNF